MIWRHTPHTGIAAILQLHSARSDVKAGPRQPFGARWISATALTDRHIDPFPSSMRDWICSKPEQIVVATMYAGLQSNTHMSDLADPHLGDTAVASTPVFSILSSTSEKRIWICD